MNKDGGNAFGRFLLRLFAFPKIRKAIEESDFVALDVNGAMGDASILLSRVLYKAKGAKVVFFSSDHYQDALESFYPSQFHGTYFGGALGHLFHRYRQYAVETFGDEPNVFHDFYNVGDVPLTAFHLLSDQLGISPKEYVPIHIDASRKLSSKKHVILNLSSVSMGDLPADFVRPIVKRLIDEGYEVYENRRGPSPLPKVTSIFPSYPELVGYCSNADLVISIRSGLCDLLAQTDTPLLVLHLHKDYLVKMPLSYWRESGIIETTVSEFALEQVDRLLGITSNN